MSSTVINSIDKMPPLKGAGLKGGRFYSKLVQENPPQSPFIRGGLSIFFTILGVLIMALMQSAHANSFSISQLQQEVKGSYKKDVKYIIPTDQERLMAEELFTHLLKSKVIKEEDYLEWKKLGFKLQVIKENNVDYAVIAEFANKIRGGRGIYIVRLSGASDHTILQAPHRPTDEQTHKIILKLFTEGKYVAAGWNTTLRSNVDLAKEPKSYFNSFTIAVAKSFAEPNIIQLHAFDNATHKIDGDMILSSTTKNPAPIYHKVASCLRSQLGTSSSYNILQYPIEIEELGGTLNINAKLFYAANPKGKFFHVETSMDLRLALRDKKSLRGAFSKCFIGE